MKITDYEKELSQLSEGDKLNYIMAISDENIKYQLLSCLANDYYKAIVIKSFVSTKLKFECLKLLKNDSDKIKIIDSINDEALRFEALARLEDDYEKVKIIETFGEELKIRAVPLLKTDYYKIAIISKITNEYIKQSLLVCLSSDYNKVKIIQTFSSDELKLESLKTIQNDDEKLNIICTIKDVNLVISALPLLVKDSSKTKIIGQINDEHIRYNLLSTIIDEYERNNMIKTLIDDKLKLKALTLLSREMYKTELIITIVDENDRFEALAQLKYDSDKIQIIETLSDELKAKAIALLQSDELKKKIISKIANESIRLSLVKYLVWNINKIEILEGLTNDELKAEGIRLLEYDGDKAKIIKSINDELLRYKLLHEIKQDYSKVDIISSFRDERLLYSAISDLKKEYDRFNVITNVENDSVKFKLLALINSEDTKVKIIKGMADKNCIANCINLLNFDVSKLQAINYLDDEMMRISFLASLEKSESKFMLLEQIHSQELKTGGLKLIDNYQNTMKKFFDKGEYEYIYHFSKSILEEIFDDKQIRILNEYSKIKSTKIRKLYSEYIIKNYDNVNMENIDQISQVLFRIEMSNSSELQAFGDIIAFQCLNHNNSLYYFSEIENIFIKNNMPYVGKIFEVFKLLHSSSKDYKNYSPLLNRFKGSVHEVELIDIVVFNDLLKCALGSNNRSIKEFISDIEKGNLLLSKVVANTSLLNLINDSEKRTLIKYLDRIEIILDGYDQWVNKSNVIRTSEELLIRIRNILDHLNLPDNNLHELPNIIVKKFCGVSGIDTFDNMKKYIEYIVLKTDKDNRGRCQEPFVLEEGDFVKGINDVKYLSRILQNGSVSKEFLGDSSGSDLTPLDTDLSRIMLKDIDGKSGSELGKIISSTSSGGYGSTWLVLKYDHNKIDVTRDSVSEKIKPNLSSKLEAFQTLKDGHYGIRTGFASSDISYIVSKSHFDRIGLEIAMNGFYIPVVNVEGKLVFTPEDYDKLRNQMSGLSYYGENNYVFSNNLINSEVIHIASQVEQNNIQTKTKRDLINEKIKCALLKLGLIFKDKIDGDLSEGTVELIDTGSTGRGTNKPGDGDFDFMMRLDKSILSSPEKLAELKSKILNELGKENSHELTSAGDFRLKNVKINNDIFVDIDITFTGKTDKIAYSTDMCLQDRLENIYKQNSLQYNYVVANILLAKQVLKEGNAYKPNRGETPQGGLGGVGIENWILQNGGSFIDAARSFLNAAEGKAFEEFKNSYYIWDFGENHMAERRGQYIHDNFVSNNMSQSGYFQMVQVLHEFVRDYETKYINIPKR